VGIVRNIGVSRFQVGNLGPMQMLVRCLSGGHTRGLRTSFFKILHSDALKDVKS